MGETNDPLGCAPGQLLHEHHDGHAGVPAKGVQIGFFASKRGPCGRYRATGGGLRGRTGGEVYGGKGFLIPNLPRFRRTRPRGGPHWCMTHGSARHRSARARGEGTVGGHLLQLSAGPFATGAAGGERRLHAHGSTSAFGDRTIWRALSSSSSPPAAARDRGRHRQGSQRHLPQHMTVDGYEAPVEMVVDAAGRGAAASAPTSPEPAAWSSFGVNVPEVYPPAPMPATR